MCINLKKQTSWYLVYLLFNSCCCRQLLHCILTGINYMEKMFHYFLKTWLKLNWNRCDLKWDLTLLGGLQLGRWYAAQCPQCCLTMWQNHQLNPFMLMNSAYIMPCYIQYEQYDLGKRNHDCHYVRSNILFIKWTIKAEQNNYTWIHLNITILLCK